MSVEIALVSALASTSSQQDRVGTTVGKPRSVAELIGGTVVTVGQAGPDRQPSTLELEKHLDDVEKNRGYLSRDTALRVRRQSLDSADHLGRWQPRELSRQLSYESGLGYDRRARMSVSVAGVIESLQGIVTA